jgi:uncharacterized membrane protein YidH (DUF202 family)
VKRRLRVPVSLFWPAVALSVLGVLEIVLGAIRFNHALPNVATAQIALGIATLVLGALIFERHRRSTRRGD